MRPRRCLALGRGLTTHLSQSGATRAHRRPAFWKLAAAPIGAPSQSLPGRFADHSHAVCDRTSQGGREVGTKTPLAPQRERDRRGLDGFVCRCIDAVERKRRLLRRFRNSLFHGSAGQTRSRILKLSRARFALFLEIRGAGHPLDGPNLPRRRGRKPRNVIPAIRCPRPFMRRPAIFKTSCT